MSEQADLGFSYRTGAQGSVHIARAGREVVILRANAAAKFLAKAQGASAGELQLLCARVTGNYKRGNESRASEARWAKGHGA